MNLILRAIRLPSAAALLILLATLGGCASPTNPHHTETRDDGPGEPAGTTMLAPEDTESNLDRMEGHLTFRLRLA